MANPIVQQILQALQQADEDHYRRQQLGLQQREAGLREQQFGLQKQATEQELARGPLVQQQLEQNIAEGKQKLEAGTESLKHLRLQNEALAQQNKLFETPESLDSLVKGATQPLGQIKPEEDALLKSSIAEARQKRSLAPVTDAISRIYTQRGIAGRAEDAQAEAWKRLLRTQENLFSRQQAITDRQKEMAEFRFKLQSNQKLRAELQQTLAAETVLDKFEKTLAEWLNDKSVANGIRLRAQREAFSRLLGRALGEKGVFTDYDKADFARVLGPGLVLSTADPQLAYQQIEDIRTLLNDIKKRKSELYGQTPTESAKPKDAKSFLDKLREKQNAGHP